MGGWLAVETPPGVRPGGPGRAAPRLVRRLCLGVFVLIGGYLLLVGANFIRLRWPDFEYFYKGGAWLLDHGSLDRGVDLLPGGQVQRRGALEWYLPFVPRLMTLLAWLPYPVAGGCWLGLNLLAMFATLRLIGRNLMGLPPQDWPVTMLLPFGLLAVFWYWEYRLNQIDNLTLLLLVGSFVCWSGGRPRIAGFWLGLAVLIKLIPVLLAVWFALKRQLRVVACAALTFLLAGPVSDWMVFGTACTLEEYRAWAYAAVHRTSHHGLILSQTEMDWRNQGLGAVLCRWLHPTSYATRFDNEPRAPASPYPKLVNVADLRPRSVARIVTVVLALSLAGLLVLTRKPARLLTSWQLRLEWALCMLAMLWFMPVMRRYHIIWALPATALLSAAVHQVGRRQRWSLLALGCLLTVLASQIALYSKEFIGTNLLEGMGILLGCVPVLALPLVALLLRLARDPDVMPQDAFVQRPAGGQAAPARPRAAARVYA